MDMDIDTGTEQEVSEFEIYRLLLEQEPSFNNKFNTLYYRAECSKTYYPADELTKENYEEALAYTEELKEALRQVHDEIEELEEHKRAVETIEIPNVVKEWNEYAHWDIFLWDEAHEAWKNADETRIDLAKKIDKNQVMLEQMKEALEPKSRLVDSSKILRAARYNMPVETYIAFEAHFLAGEYDYKEGSTNE